MFVLNISQWGLLRTKKYSLPPEKRTSPAWHGDRNHRAAKCRVREMENFKRKNIKVPPGLSKSIFFLENCNYSTVQDFFLNVCRGFWGFFFPSPSWQHLLLTSDLQSLYLPRNVNEKLTKCIFTLYSSSGIEQRIENSTASRKLKDFTMIMQSPAPLK